MNDLNSTKKNNDCLIQNGSSYCRIYFKEITVVVKREQINLKEALHKLKLRYNLRFNIDKCIAYVKETKHKIDLNVLLNKITADDISIIKIEDHIKHNFARSLFHIKNSARRTCDSCRRRLIISINSCKNCNYSICSSDECKLFSESILCIRDLVSSSSSYSILSKIRKKDSIFYPQKNHHVKTSNQILPLKQIRPCLSYRMRSSSNSELKTLDMSVKEDFNNNIDEESSVVKRINKKPRNSLKTRSSRWNSVISCEIQFSTVQVSNKIGTGSYGYVHKALIPNNTDAFGAIVAIKFLNVKNPTPYQTQLFRNEIAILKSSKHENILAFVGCILQPYLAIVTEWCPGSSLYRHIHVDEELWEMNQLIDIAKQISSGMEYLHNKSILHRDLKSNNIFLIPKESSDLLCGQNFKVKIGDFGLAMITTINKYDLLNKSNNLNGSILWMAPEVITQRIEDPYTTKSDVYSYGVVLYEMMTGKLPYMKKEQSMILFLVGSGRLKLNIEDIDRDDVPEEIKDLILTCSKYERNERLEFIEINQRLSLIKLEERPRTIRRHSLPDINSNPKNSYICSKFVLKDSGERFNDIKIDLIEDYLENDNHIDSNSDAYDNLKNIDKIIHEK